MLGTDTLSRHNTNIGHKGGSGMANILIVEDDLEIASFVSAALNKTGFKTSLARDRATALAQFERQIPDLVILDVMLPGEDGFGILARIRQRYQTPVIMLTAMSEIEDRVKGLSKGADDYVSKPFQMVELIARVNAVLRRIDFSDQTDSPTPAIYTFDGWRVDTRNRRVQDPSGAVVMLTSGEFDVLQVFCQHAGSVLSRDRLVQISQNRMVEPYDRSVDTLVSRIRKKLQNVGNSDQMIKTVRHEGYLFTPMVKEAHE